MTVLPWDMTDHLRDHAICDAYLEVARERYPDLLLKVRQNIARAMSGWLMIDGVRADVRWSDEENRFTGRLRGFGDDVAFHGETPTELRNAFAEAVRVHVLRTAA